MNIKEVAAQIGVSTYTVSCAITGRGSLSATTRRRVLKKVRELGYTPNVNGQRLVTGRSNLIALDDRRPGLFADPFGMQLARGIQHALQTAGYNLLLNTATGSAQESDQLRYWVKSRTVGGVIIVRTSGFDPDLIREMSAAHIPCVVIGTWTEALPYVASIRIRNTGVRQAARMLVEQGHRRIALINSADPHMEEAVIDELALCGVSLPPEYLLTLPLPEGTDAPFTDVADGMKAFQQLMAANSPPTAILARSDALALGVLRAANRRGIRVPQNLSVVGHEDLPLAEYSDPPLTSVRLDCTALGQTATEALLGLMEDQDDPPPVRTVETVLVCRQSVAAAP